MAKLFANSGDPDQTPRSAVSDLGLHCLLITLLRVSQLQWVKSDQSHFRYLIRFSDWLVQILRESIIIMIMLKAPA